MIKLGAIMWRSGKGGTKKPPQQGSSLAAFWLSAFIGMTVLIAFGAGAWVFSEHDRQQRLARERLDLLALCDSMCRKR